MRDFAFISRHEPTQGQSDLAAEQGIRLWWVGDFDGFTVEPEAVAYRLTSLLGDFDHTPYAGWRVEQVKGVVVVHAAAALRLTEWWDVGIFENGNRAAEGEPPTFEAVALHIFPALGRGEVHGNAVGYNQGYAAGVADGRTMW